MLFNNISLPRIVFSIEIMMINVNDHWQVHVAVLSFLFGGHFIVHLISGFTHPHVS
jgi:hypothetical protein